MSESSVRTELPLNPNSKARDRVVVPRFKMEISTTGSGGTTAKQVLVGDGY